MVTEVRALQSQKAFVPIAKLSGTDFYSTKTCASLEGSGTYACDISWNRYLFQVFTVLKALAAMAVTL